MSKITVKLSSRQGSKLGKALGKILYFSTFLHDLKEIDKDFDYWGCPHDGGEHTLGISSNRHEILVHLELFMEKCNDDWLTHNVFLPLMKDVKSNFSKTVFNVKNYSTEV